MNPKLTKNSAAVELLFSKFRNGKITEAKSPSEVGRSETIFKQYSLLTLRTRFQEVKNDVLASNKGMFITIIHKLHQLNVLFQN